MMPTKISCWKRFFSFMLTLLLLLAVLPISAFAELQTSAMVYNIHKIEDTGASLTSSLDAETTLTPKHNSTNTPSKITNLWVYSSSMTTDEQQNGGVIPYVDDKEENRWYLKEIIWANSNSFNKATEKITLMNSEQIATAQGVPDYNVDLSEYEIGAPDDNDRYFIWYVWTQTAPDSTGDEETYTVHYDLNLPSGTNINAISIIEQKLYSCRWLRECFSRG